MKSERWEREGRTYPSPESLFFSGLFIFTPFLSGLLNPAFLPLWADSGEQRWESRFLPRHPAALPADSRRTARRTPLLGKESVPGLCCSVLPPLLEGKPDSLLVRAGCWWGRLAPWVLSSSNTQRVTLQGASPFASTSPLQEILSPPSLHFAPALAWQEREQAQVRNPTRA